MKLSFKKNVGTIDQLFRVTLGVLILGLGFFNILPFSFWANTLIIIFGITQVIEGIIGY